MSFTAKLPSTPFPWATPTASSSAWVAKAKEGDKLAPSSEAIEQDPRRGLPSASPLSFSCCGPDSESNRLEDLVLSLLPADSLGRRRSSIRRLPDLAPKPPPQDPTFTCSYPFQSLRDGAITTPNPPSALEHHKYAPTSANAQQSDQMTTTGGCTLAPPLRIARRGSHIGQAPRKPTRCPSPPHSSSSSKWKHLPPSPPLKTTDLAASSPQQAPVRDKPHPIAYPGGDTSPFPLGDEGSEALLPTGGLPQTPQTPTKRFPPRASSPRLSPCTSRRLSTATASTSLSSKEDWREYRCFTSPSCGTDASCSSPGAVPRRGQASRGSVGSSRSVASPRCPSTFSTRMGEEHEYLSPRQNVQLGSNKDPVYMFDNSSVPSIAYRDPNHLPTFQRRWMDIDQNSNRLRAPACVNGFVVPAVPISCPASRRRLTSNPTFGQEKTSPPMGPWMIPSSQINWPCSSVSHACWLGFHSWSCACAPLDPPTPPPQKPLPPLPSDNPSTPARRQIEVKPRLGSRRSSEHVSWKRVWEESKESPSMLPPVPTIPLRRSSSYAPSSRWAKKGWENFRSILPGHKASHVSFEKEKEVVPPFCARKLTLTEGFPTIPKADAASPARSSPPTCRLSFSAASPREKKDVGGGRARSSTGHSGSRPPRAILHNVLTRATSIHSADLRS